MVTRRLVQDGSEVPFYRDKVEQFLTSEAVILKTFIACESRTVFQEQSPNTPHCMRLNHYGSAGWKVLKVNGFYNECF